MLEVGAMSRIELSGTIHQRVRRVYGRGGYDSASKFLSRPQVTGMIKKSCNPVARVSVLRAFRAV